MLGAVATVSINGHMRCTCLAEVADPAVHELVRSGLRGGAVAGSLSSEVFWQQRAAPQGQPDAGAADEQVAAALELCGLARAYATRLFRELSVGEQRLVLLARALVRGPRLLVLDEAAQGLDPHARGRLNDVVRWLSVHTDCAVVVITHHADEVPGETSHLLELESGRVVDSGPVRSADDVRRLIASDYQRAKDQAPRCV